MKRVFKRILLIVLAGVVLLMLYIAIMSNWHYWADMRSFAEPWGADRDLTQTDQGVRFEVYCGGERHVVFDANRNVVEADGFSPLAFDRRNLWGVWSYDAFVAAYGKPHFYIGNAWEAWITDDGYVIELWLPRSSLDRFPFNLTALAGEVTMYDLFAPAE